MSLMSKLRGDQRGISSIITATCVFAFMGAAMLTLDAGNLFGTRRMIITGTDAAVLDAAQQFNLGLLDPCSTAGRFAAETHATNVLTQNHPGSLHNPTDTPDGFEVTMADPALCGTASYVPGKVRYDGRLTSQGFFSRAMGFGDGSAISSSTAAWGYVQSIGEGLRPIAICDKTEQYTLWSDYFFAGKTPEALATYNSYFGRDEYLNFTGATEAELTQIHFPSTSSGYVRGTSAHNPNKNKSYIVPDGTLGHTTIHRITMPEALCGASPGNRVWLDFEDVGDGTVGTSELVDQILYGYKGEVALSPHDCNPSNDNPTPEDCGAASGNRASLERHLGTITCNRNTPALSCPYVFPVLVVDEVTQAGGANAHYVQVAFLFVVLRGFGNIENHEASVQFDFEFVDVQTSGEIGAAPPSGSHPYQTGVQLCGADHDPAGDRCPF